MNVELMSSNAGRPHKPVSVHKLTVIQHCLCKWFGTVASDLVLHLRRRSRSEARERIAMHLPIPQNLIFSVRGIRAVKEVRDGRCDNLGMV